MKCGRDLGERLLDAALGRPNERAGPDGGVAVLGYRDERVWLAAEGLDCELDMPDSVDGTYMCILPG